MAAHLRPKVNATTSPSSAKVSAPHRSWAEAQVWRPTVTQPRSSNVSFKDHVVAERFTNVVGDALHPQHQQHTAGASEVDVPGQPLSLESVLDAPTAASAVAAVAATSPRQPSKPSAPRPSTAAAAASTSAAGAGKSVASRQGALPQHVKRTGGVMRSNLGALHDFARAFPSMTPVEVSTASTRLAALLRAQQSAVDDLLTYTAEELKFARDRIGDLTTAQHESDGTPGTAAALNGYRSLYAMLHATATVVCAADAYILVADEHADVAPVPIPASGGGGSSGVKRGVGKSTATLEGVFESPQQPAAASRNATGKAAKLPTHVAATGGSSAAGDAHHPVSGNDGPQLSVAVHVSASPVTPAHRSGMPRPLFDACTTCAATTSAVNMAFKAAPPGTPLSERTLLAIPVRVPGNDRVVCGVVAFVGKLAGSSAYSGACSAASAAMAAAAASVVPSTSALTVAAGVGARGPQLRSFTRDDELRVSVLAEQLAVLISSLPVGLGYGSAGAPPVSPASWQADWATWAQARTSSSPASAAAAPATPSGRRATAASTSTSSGLIDSTAFAKAELTAAASGGASAGSDSDAPPRRRFILRTDLSARAVHKLLAAPTRATMSAAGLLADLSDRLAVAERSFREAQAALDAKAQQCVSLEARLGDMRDELTTASRDAGDMRTACERVLRLAYLDRGKGGEGGSGRLRTATGMCDGGGSAVEAAAEALFTSVASSPRPGFGSQPATPSHHQQQQQQQQPLRSSANNGCTPPLALSSPGGGSGVTQAAPSRASIPRSPRR